MEDGRAYLFMGKAEFVLQDSLPITKELNFICQNIKIISQGFGEFLVVEVFAWHVVVLGYEEGFF
jgi:hypothetical protein